MKTTLELEKQNVYPDEDSDQLSCIYEKLSDKN